MTTPVTLRTSRSAQSARALALAGVALLTFSATASAQAPAQAPAVKAAPSVATEAPVVRRESPAGFMKRVGNELLAA